MPRQPRPQPGTPAYIAMIKRCKHDWSERDVGGIFNMKCRKCKHKKVRFAAGRGRGTR